MRLWAASYRSLPKGVSIAGGIPHEPGSTRRLRLDRTRPYAAVPGRWCDLFPVEHPELTARRRTDPRLRVRMRLCLREFPGPWRVPRPAGDSSFGSWYRVRCIVADRL